MTPLHRAIIDNDEMRLKDPAFITQWRDVPDQMGFTPQEIAQFLGKYRYSTALGSSLPHSFSLHPNGIKKPIDFSLNAFEKALGIRYRPFLTFTSYQHLEEVVNQCPYLLRSRWLASDNYDSTTRYQTELRSGTIAPMCIRWIDISMGYGAFASQEMPEGTWIGEYTGIVRRLYRNHPDQNPYCFHYPSKWWSCLLYMIDGIKEGNLTRFINHSATPNLNLLCLVDRKLLHQVLVTNRHIQKGEELTFDYGEDYWSKRQPR